MRAILVGCGAMAVGWLRAIRHELLRDKVEIVCLVDIHLETAKQFAQQQALGAVPFSNNIQDALDIYRPDMVFDVTVPEARALVVKAALDFGAHIISEKPMATSMQEALALQEYANNAHRHFVIIQNRRYKTGIRRLKQFLDSGAIGTVNAAHADFFIGARFGGFREQMQHVLLLDMAIHTFDAARFLLSQEPQTVYCYESNPTGSWYAHGAAASAIFQMSGNTQFTYRGSWCAEGANTHWDASWRIVGAKGTVLWDGESGFEARLGTGEETFLRDTQALDVPDNVNPDETLEHASVIANCLNAIANNQVAATDCTDNIHSMAMVFAAINSAKQQRVEHINDYLTLA